MSAINRRQIINKRIEIFRDTKHERHPLGKWFEFDSIWLECERKFRIPLIRFLEDVEFDLTNYEESCSIDSSGINPAFTG